MLFPQSDFEIILPFGKLQNERKQDGCKCDRNLSPKKIAHLCVRCYETGDLNPKRYDVYDVWQNYLYCSHHLACRRKERESNASRTQSKDKAGNFGHSPT